MDGRAWKAVVYGVSDGRTRLHFHFHFHALEKEMATFSSVLAWRIPGMDPVYAVAQSRTRLKRLSSSRTLLPVLNNQEYGDTLKVYILF